MSTDHTAMLFAMVREWYTAALRTCWTCKVFCGAGRGYWRAVAALEGSSVGSPASSAKGWLVQNTGIEVDETFANAIVIVVEIAESEVVKRKVLVHEKRHGVGKRLARWLLGFCVPTRLAANDVNIHMLHL